MTRTLAIVGAGWAGLAAAVAASAAGHEVSVFELARQLGGRARSLPLQLPDGRTVHVDNGQHILAGAYRETLRLMRTVGVEPDAALLRLPLTLRFPDGTGLALPPRRPPLDAVVGILGARGWTLGDKLSLLAAATRWRRNAFECPAATSVATLCDRLTPTVMSQLIEPLCVSALNTPAAVASGQVFLRVLRDTLFEPDGSNLLLPRCDLETLFPQAAARWLEGRGVTIAPGRRVQRVAATDGAWTVDGTVFDKVLLACPAGEAARLVADSGAAADQWVRLAGALRHEAIATVYACGDVRLPVPMLALRSDAQRPAQFVFDRAQLGGPAGLLAFVVSACPLERDAVEARVMEQARELGWGGLQPVQTVVEKRATFACTPGLRRPPSAIAPGLAACGDYVEGPYPATLEGAVRSALEGVAQLS